MPHYTRSTDPPKKNPVFLRDVLGLGGCPAARSEWGHLHVSAPRYAVLQPNSARGEVSELSVFGCSEVQSRYAWVTYPTAAERTSWGPFQPELLYDPVILHFTSPELLLQPVGNPFLHPTAVVTWLHLQQDGSWHWQQCFSLGTTAEQIAQNEVDVLSFIGRHIIKARYVWAGHNFLTCIISRILESGLSQIFSLYCEPFCEHHQASWLLLCS